MVNPIEAAQLPLPLLRRCAESFPERPELNVAEWPYSRDELERFVSLGMEIVRLVVKDDG
ncbi:hypothetical protein ACIQTZ_00415 [Paenarthrobacter sp. NPDC090520]|uniref:hypothetical protein n=1 Tax=Paenarthrobacter sp. NPDC090520 TaxID=3364382 RepID=UPI003802A907